MKAWSLISVTFVSLTFIAACGSKSDDKDEAAATSTTLTYSNVSSIINGSCATNSDCHGSGSVYNDYSTLAKLKPYASTMVSSITAARMPKNDTTSFATTADGVKLLEWLRGGSDLK